MLVFGLFEGERVTVDVPPGATVKDVKIMIQVRLNIPMDVCRHDQKILVLTYGGADLGDDWIFSDLGIVPGTTVRIQLKEEIKPVLYIRCSHNKEVVSIVGNINVSRMPVKDLRTIAQNKTGLPMAIFRLTTLEGREMYDGHCLDEYGLDVGQTLKLENWDGYNEFINLCIMGFTPQVLSQLSSDEVVCRFQTKVALFIASHFGNVDLARCMLRQGASSSESIGEHPQRMWCKAESHIETYKAPMHQATEMGQLGILRLFVNHDVTCLLAKDGNGLAAINLALRKKIKPCASFLLTKQMNRVNFSKNQSFSLVTYHRIKCWCETAKEKAYLKYGFAKSSLKRRSFNGPLVGYGIIVDGFSTSPMNGKPKMQIIREDKEKQKPSRSVRQLSNLTQSQDPDHYFRQAGAVLKLKALQMDKTPDQKLKKMFDKSKPNPAVPTKLTQIKDLVNSETDEKLSKSPSTKTHDGTLYTASSSNSEQLKFPSISEQSRRLKIASLSTANVSMSQREELASESSRTDDKSYPKSKRAYFHPTQSKLFKSMPNVNLTITDRSEKSQNPDTVTSVTSTSSVADEGSKSDDVTPDSSVKKRKVRRKRLTSAVMLSKAKGTENAIPLPLISNETDSRPFFYLNGQREDEYFGPLMDLISRSKGANSRERAIKSMSIANSFKEKPWLCQIRMALSMNSKSVRRNASSAQARKHIKAS
ncbi:protein ANKUB1-like [Gigantopelta aegis]|uniref:protein ANKUB1-like n=1 Tax=Gigantopelta aegis TaxID=1735272 RepID=UPI001B88943B|nr:protein ANKUB1-like [Gigantopelta aegis]XP_041348256.1 protein ANKUB1-like [Gigantopelta aegis]